MDELIISHIVCHLDEKDLICFSLTNKQTYHYCTHTNVKNKKCNNKHTKHHFTLSLYEHARLSYCVNILSQVKTLHDHKISLQRCAIYISLKKPCGTNINIILGRDITFNSIVYSYDTYTALCDLHKDVTKVYNISDNMERLEHKLYSIISHQYIDQKVKVIHNIDGDYQNDIVDCYIKNINKYFLKMLFIKNM